MSGLPITLKHPYPSAVTEPSLYDMISRHVVCGSVPASRTLSASDPDQGSISMTLSVSNILYPLQTLKGSFIGDFTL